LNDETDVPTSTDDQAAENGLPDVEKVAAEAAVETTTTETADENVGDEGEDSEEEKSRAKERREQRQRRQERLIRENAVLEERLRALEARNQPETTRQAEEGPPKEEDFKDYFEFLEAKAVWKAEQKLRPLIDEARQSAQQFRDEQSQDAALKAYNTRLKAFEKSAPDFKDVVADMEDLPANHPVLPAIKRAIVESDIGPQILYHLAKNPGMVERLGAMDAFGAAKELGKLEAKLTPAKPRTETRAPDPIKTLKGGSVATKDPANMSMDEYVAWRNSGGGK
jgi:hypothetical protein